MLAGCGGSGESADPPGADTGVVASLPDTADCPVRDHLAIEHNGATRRGLTEPIDYSFLEAQKGGCRPVRFNPCQPIHYVLNAALAPPGALDDLVEAIRRVEAATGLTFVNDGPTDEPAALSRPLNQAARYGNRWPPLLIVWDRGGPYRMEITNPAGAKSVPIDDAFVTGSLIVNIDAVGGDGFSKPAGGFGAGASWGRILLHELGHIVGLGHVARSDQLMFPELGVQRGDAVFQPGDLAGLRLVGRDAGCFTTPPPPPVR